MQPSVIAIDGPAGSGKTVVGRRLAEALGYLYLDTGAFYRALTWLTRARGIDAGDGAAIGRLAKHTQIEIERPTVDDGRPYTVLVDGTDVTRELSSPEVAETVSIVAAHPEVRAALLPLQRRVAAQGKVVMAGRDIGTVVCPFAGLKLYFKAPLPVRVARRLAQLAAMGLPADPGQVAAEIAERDRLDQARAVAPLKPAPDAVVVDTATLTIDEELAYILDLLARQDP
jgi:cytidylate kinase